MNPKQPPYTRPADVPKTKDETQETPKVTTTNGGRWNSDYENYDNKPKKGGR